MDHTKYLLLQHNSIQAVFGRMNVTIRSVTTQIYNGTRGITTDTPRSGCNSIPIVK